MPIATTPTAFGASRSIHSVVRDRLSGRLVGAHRRPVALALDLLVGDRAFDDQHERIELPCRGLVEELQELFAVLVGEHRVVQVHFRAAREWRPGSRPRCSAAWRR